MYTRDNSFSPLSLASAGTFSSYENRPPYNLESLNDTKYNTFLISQYKVVSINV